ncbi:unnamed protein product [Rotaria sp. Silwood2]|nr:unnamed protein product [Rotaria sp. Silwood2]CAF3301240.1 unnamed protein product [Rotaria sp. Silwood2]CAF4406813.1 unnamed protein product [Rotaria sp. Silwood2]CAF4458639.1 unnamed protein product [Rotaria sp. Silwood2]CAF4523179.1 unnamed protein product [Rotaria sp. Silwood2]
MITPEVAVEIVRNCDVKTEEMILNSEDDDDRPFSNPSHELVQKALVSWRERMLRADNITCITVMLDPPGPPFSEYSVCSDGTVEVDQAPSLLTSETPQRPKLAAQRKEHILTPISNGSTFVRTPKRPASGDITEMLDDTPRRKLIKINQQKENNTTSPLRNEIELPLVPSTNNEEDDQKFLPLTQQTQTLSTFDDDLARKVEQCFRNHTKEQQPVVDMMEIDELNQISSNNNKQKSSTRRRSHFRFSFSNNHNSPEQEQEEKDETNSKRKSRLFRTHSASIINTNENENENNIHSSRRRKSYSTTG